MYYVYDVSVVLSRTLHAVLTLPCSMLIVENTHIIIVTLPPLGVQSIACLYVCMYVCLSVHSPFSKTTRPNFTKFSVHVTCGRGSMPHAMYFRFYGWRIVFSSHSWANGPKCKTTLMYRCTRRINLGFVSFILMFIVCYWFIGKCLVLCVIDLVSSVPTQVIGWITTLNNL